MKRETGYAARIGMYGHVMYGHVRLRSFLAYEQSARGTVVGGIPRGIDWYLNCIHTMKPR